MWRRIDTIKTTIKCDECGSDMEAMWTEFEDGRNERSTVFHCRNCLADRELVECLNQNNQVELSYIGHYFHG